MLNKLNLHEYLSSFSSANSLSADLLQNSLTGKTNVLLNDYSQFQKHIFFGNATRKTTVVLNELLDQYPIGINGNAITGLTSDSIARWENWSLTADGFTKFVLNYACGATGSNVNSSITTSATSTNSSIVYLNALERNSTNSLTNISCINNITNLLELAMLFDEGITKLKINSGTGSDLFVIPTYDQDIVDKIIPENIRVAINRGPSLEKYMTHQTPYFIQEDELEVFQRLIDVLGDFFDSIKEYIDQFSNTFNFQYSGFDRAPEGLVQFLAAKQFGLELFDGAIAGNLSDYFQQSGENGLQKTTTQIWNRILNDIVSLYKGKGTKQALLQLMRDFGFYEGFLSIREYVDNIETGLNTYEKNINVKIPKFGASGFNNFKISTPSTSSINIASLMFQVSMPFIEDYTSGEYPIGSFFNNRFVYDATNKKYVLYSSFTGSTSAYDLWTSEEDVTILNGFIANQQTPFFFSISGFSGPSTSQSTFITNIFTVNSLSSGSLSISGNAIYRGVSLSSLNFASSSGDYFFSNIKLFTKLHNSLEYIRNPHVRFSEENLICDYKLYDSPATTALNSYIGSLTGSITSVTGSLSGGLSAYDVLPINFKRDFQATGLMSAGGDFFLDEKSKKRGSNNLGYGLFSSEAINNDILDFYTATSSSASNISAFYLDPQYYYELNNDKTKWRNLDEHRKLVINKNRYPNGIQNEKFLKLIYIYRHTLSNFFNTADQFIRFRSKVVQKGVNFEPTLLDRNKHQIFTSNEKNEAFDISLSSYEILTENNFARDISITALSTTAFHQIPILNEPKILFALTSFHKNADATFINSVTFSSSTEQAYYSSISAIPSQTGSVFSYQPMSITGSMIENIAYKGVMTKNNDKNSIKSSLLNNSLTTIISINKDLLENSESIFIPVEKTMDLVYYPNSKFLGVGTPLRINFSETSYISGINIYSSFTATPASSFSGSLKYFITTYNGTVPISGTLSGISFYSNTAVGIFNATILKNYFQSIGNDNSSGYYRKFAKINLSLQSDQTFLKSKENVFLINSPVDPETNLPLLHYYCYNNNQYYMNASFSLPVYSKNGVNLLVCVNPAFNNIIKGKQTINVLNLLNGNTDRILLNIIRTSDDYTDSGLIQFNSSSRTQDSLSSSSNFILNTQVTTLTNSDVSSSGITFGTSRIDEDKGLMVFLNGWQQDKNVFWTYNYSGGNNNLVFTNVGSLSAGDVISMFFYY